MSDEFVVLVSVLVERMLDECGGAGGFRSGGIPERGCGQGVGTGLRSDMPLSCDVQQKMNTFKSE